MALGWRSKKEFDEYFALFDKMFRDLKKKDQLNSEYKTIRKESENLIHYFDFCRAGLNRWDRILSNKHIFENFKSDVVKYNIDENTFMNIYGQLLMYNILVIYANIENILLTILKGARFGNGKNDFIQGNETLGTLFRKIDKLYPNNKLPKDILDIKFRNALAHGWYVIEKRKFYYYEDALLTKKKILPYEKLFLKHHQLNLLGMAITYLVLAMDY